MADPPTHFFKFVPPGFLFNLSIPTSFLTNLNSNRCSKAILRRGCHEWSVDIDDGVFGDGWRRFVRENGVQEFDFIVFKHQGSMSFDILVFDQSTCEKQYPNLYEEMDGEEPLTESDMISKHGPIKLKKRKRNDCLAQDEEYSRVGDSGRCFISKMTPFVIKKSRLHVPMEFARSNGLITQSIRTQVYIMDDKHRKWPAILQLRMKMDICLTGWREFRVVNHLNVGDVCMFELVKDGEVPVFKCYRNNFIKNHIQVKVTSSTQNNRPYFISNLKPTSLKRSVLYLPVDFSTQNGLKVGEIILRDNKHRSWKVHLNKFKERSFYLGYGLRAFLAANDMKEGDAFKFELVEKEKDKPPIVNFLFLDSKQIYSLKEAKSAQKEASVLCEKGLSYFVGVLRSCSIRRSLLFLPKGFARNNGLIDNKRMILRNADDERSWTVELKNCKNKSYYIGRGWDDFRAANGLKEGDHFKFELVDNGETPIVNFYLENFQ